MADENERYRIREEKRLLLDDGIGRELKKLSSDWTLKLTKELSRKEQQLNKVYEAALEKKYVKRRKKDRSVRTVEGYSDDWFKVVQEEEEEEDSSSNVGSGGGGGNNTTTATTNKLKKKNKDWLSAGERASAKMGKRIHGKDDSEFAEFSFEPGIQVWKAVGFHMQLDRKVSKGMLLKGASYIIVHITDDISAINGVSGGGGGGGGGGGLEIHLYHWVGSAASLDSKTVSSFKCTELARRLRHDMAESLEDDRTSAKTVKMMRESEGEESAEFLHAMQSHLKHVSSKAQLRYVEGGSTSALHRPPPKHDRPRLFRVSLLTSQVGNKSPTPLTPKPNTPKSFFSVGPEDTGAGRLGGTPKHKQLKPRVEASLCEVERRETSLKAEWVLILDGGKDTIFVFRGFLSTTLHRAKAFEMAFLMRQVK